VQQFDRHPSRRPVRRGLTVVELVIAFTALVILLAVLIPSMHRARISAWRDQSQSNLRRLHQAWASWLEDYDGRFPFIAAQPGWRWGGVRHSSVTGRPFLDSERPLSRIFEGSAEAVDLFRCPADAGIVGPTPGVGTGSRTCFEAYGTSYRANANLLDARLNIASGRSVVGDLARGLRLGEIETPPSRLVLLGEPQWAEILRGTGLNAAWYDEPDRANLLFLDGRVAYERIDAAAGGVGGGPVFTPALRWTVRPGADDR
jgi:prepilin-type processing-associated H-X9-DG protein